MDSILRHRTPAPVDWLAGQIGPDLDRRRQVVEACRAELTWARADWMELALTAEGWQDGCLPHELAADRLLTVWGDLQPLEGCLKEAIERLRAQRRAGWDWRLTLADVQKHRRARRHLWQAFLAAAASYRDRRAQLGLRDADRMQAHAFLIRPHAGVTRGVRFGVGR